MKPLRKDLGHIKIAFLDVRDQAFFDGEIIEYVAALLERPIIDVVYFPLREEIYHDLQGYLWLIPSN